MEAGNQKKTMKLINIDHRLANINFNHEPKLGWTWHNTCYISALHASIDTVSAACQAWIQLAWHGMIHNVSIPDWLMILQQLLRSKKWHGTICLTPRTHESKLKKQEGPNNKIT